MLERVDLYSLMYGVVCLFLLMALGLDHAGNSNVLGMADSGFGCNLRLQPLPLD